MPAKDMLKIDCRENSESWKLTGNFYPRSLNKGFSGGREKKWNEDF